MSAAPPPSPLRAPATAVNAADIVCALHEVTDPEVGLGIVDLGLVRKVDVSPVAGEVTVVMTLTTPGCPMGEVLVEGVRRRILAVPGVGAATVRLTFDPPWTPDHVSPAGRARLGW